MTTKTVVCPECDAPLSPGRFACPSCGALVASVATVSRSFTQTQLAPPPRLEPAMPDEPLTALAASPHSRFDEPLPPRLANVLPPIHRAAAPIRAEKPARTEVVATQPAPRPQRRAPRQAADSKQTPLAWVLDEQAPAPAPAPVMSPPPELPEVSILAPEPAWPPTQPESTQPESTQPESTQPSTAPTAPSWPAHPTWPPPRPANGVEVEPVEPPAARVVAGAYLPPSAVLPPGEALPLPGTARKHDEAEAGGRPMRQSVSTRMHLRLGDGDGPLGMPIEAPTRIVVLGASVAGLGFLLPWARIVIGSGQIGGYLAQWGLAGPGHAVILALLVGLAVLALVAARLPRWVRLGLPSIALAFLLVGLLWPYLVGRFETSIGVYVVAIGAIVMIAGGLLDRIVTRHAESPATV